RLVKFLRVPSPQIRSVVCISLAERENDLDSSHWIGAAPRLLQLAVGDGDAIVRHSAEDALHRLPVIPAADGPAVWAFVEQPSPLQDGLRDVRISLLALLHRSNPDCLPRVLSVYHGWVGSDDDRRSALSQLLALAPDSPETYARFRWLLSANEN